MKLIISNKHHLINGGQSLSSIISNAVKHDGVAMKSIIYSGDYRVLNHTFHITP